jgi:hypothetical protein
VAFSGQATVAGGATYTGIWTDATGTLARVAQSATPAPGTAAGTNYLSFSAPTINDAGSVVFDGTVNSGGPTNLGIWEGAVAGVSLLARKGSPAPGAGTGVNFAALLTPSINDAGQVAFRAQVGGTGVTIGDNDLGIWAEKAGGLTLMARTGSPAPGTAAGIVFDGFPLPPIAINSAGRISFHAFLGGPGIELGVNRNSIWAERANGLELVVRQGSPVPGVTGGNFSFLDEHSFNRNGHIAFVGSMTGVPVATSNAVFSDGGGSMGIVARTGSAAPGTGAGVTFIGFDNALINGEGHVAFTATLGGAATATSNTGIWAHRNGALNLVVREGSEAPGAGAGINFQGFSDLVLNNAGQTAFAATLTGTGVSATNDGGIWVQGLDGQLRLVAREGSALEVSPGVNRTVSALFLAGSMNTEDGRRAGLNDLGDVAFLANFTDGSSGLFVSDIARGSGAAGDFDGDSDFDGADFLTWQQNAGRTGTGLPSNGDANGDGNVNGADLMVWRGKFGASAATAAAAIPEPASAVLALAGLVFVSCRRRR